MAKTKIEWVINPDGTQGEAWNPVSGCSKVSEGCQNCYAEAMARRFDKSWSPWTKGNAVHNVIFRPERLEQPLHWRKPRRIFVCSMGDLFHELVHESFQERVLDIMLRADHHTYLILTKRPARMKMFFQDRFQLRGPTPNIWLGVSIENQPAANERILHLLATPAAKRFVSTEPMLGPVNAVPYLGGRSYRCGCGFKETESQMVYLGGDDYLCENEKCKARMEQGPTLDWVIVGGESGPKARPMHPDWVRSIRDQCQVAGTPFFFKQWGEYKPMSGKEAEYYDNRDVYRFWRKPDGEPTSECLVDVGKKAAGRELDGRTWEEMPQ